MAGELYHFSEEPTIGLFDPRAVTKASARPPGREWLNGPLVWAIDDWHAPMYLFPRDCPRILIWPLPETTEEDRTTWWSGARDGTRMLAYIEHAWLARIGKTTIYRYQLPAETFACLEDAGMHLGKSAVTPLRIDAISDLPAALRLADVELRPVDSLTPFRGVWDSTLHASGIRLRNASGWELIELPRERG